MKRKWDVSSKETRKKCVEEIITRINELSDSEIGVKAAEDIIDIVAQNIGPDVYNLALKDAKKLLQDRLADLDTEIDLLEHKN